ncbi:MAG TPA: TonB-dependent hemoglobin/transferrin/lactoferrin family receptor, partial [Erythrobacter sp.]|nr:TonB-dependent hemoglobin/transferrin/lactoferrin family receptor [Erythrobacter sp.]
YTSLPNPDLGPETSESWEGGIKFSTEAVSLQLAAFTADYDDFISQQVVGGSFTPMDPAQYQFVNYDAVAIDGVEAKANFRMGNGFYSRFAIAYADGDILSPGQAPAPLDTIDPLNLVLGIGYRQPQGRFGGELIATHHARKPLDETDGGYRPDAFTILDATAFFAVTDALKLRAGIFNIFDEKYAYWQDVRGLSATSTTTDAYTRPGRNASVSLSFQF